MMKTIHTSYLSSVVNLFIFHFLLLQCNIRASTVGPNITKPPSYSCTAHVRPVSLFSPFYKDQSIKLFCLLLSMPTQRNKQVKFAKVCLLLLFVFLALLFWFWGLYVLGFIMYSSFFSRSQLRVDSTSSTTRPRWTFLYVSCENFSITSSLYQAFLHSCISTL